ncbi:hypothetical protein GYMLUDRAFT_117539, partial [Collybiopsis luxurians FD-317 M1]
VTLSDGTTCKDGGFVVTRGHNNSLHVGQVVEILQRERSVDSMSSQASFILIRQVDISFEAIEYRMPQVLFTDIYFTNLICTVNVQHHCVGNKCRATGSRPVYQEGHIIPGKFQPVIVHENPHHLVLNTAQMRNAIFVQHFRIRSPQLNAQELLTESVQREIDVRKAARKAVETARS